MSRSKVTVICVIAGSTSVAPMAGEVATMRGGAVGSNDGGSEDLLAAGGAVGGANPGPVPFSIPFSRVFFPHKRQKIAPNIYPQILFLADPGRRAFICQMYGFPIIIILPT